MSAKFVKEVGEMLESAAKDIQSVERGAPVGRLRTASDSLAVAIDMLVEQVAYERLVMDKKTAVVMVVAKCVSVLNAIVNTVTPLTSADIGMPIGTSREVSKAANLLRSI